MSQALNNPAGAHRGYGATATVTASSSSTTAPEVGFAAAGFSPTELMSLSEGIAHNINAINSSSKQLEKTLKLIGTPKDLPSLREKVHNINAKTNASVEATSKDLQQLSTIVRNGDKQQKLQLEKLTAEFGAVVERYTSLQQRISKAMRQSYQLAATAEHEADVSANANTELLQQQRMEQVALQEEHDKLLRREQQVIQIERDVLDANTIMSKLSTLVHQQSDQIGTIEGTIERTANEVERGAEELAKANSSRQSYRRKVLILLVIAVIIGLVVTGIIVGKLHS